MTRIKPVDPKGQNWQFSDGRLRCLDYLLAYRQLLATGDPGTVFMLVRFMETPNPAPLHREANHVSKNDTI
ncbi:MAG: hypothetical protein IGQ88_03750 [Gloeomargaritaceae cyanobacterium C42_A2020_066]|nr:hypothetical protein [Gloeomargaritaceae cyanobacterium C42_A2020_066]